MGELSIGMHPPQFCPPTKDIAWIVVEKNRTKKLSIATGWRRCLRVAPSHKLCHFQGHLQGYGNNCW